jgi:hypothetical protein
MLMMMLLLLLLLLLLLMMMMMTMLLLLMMQRATRDASWFNYVMYIFNAGQFMEEEEDMPELLPAQPNSKIKPNNCYCLVCKHDRVGDDDDAIGKVQEGSVIDSILCCITKCFVPSCV